MTDSIALHEQEVDRLLRDQLARFSARFAETGLRPEVQEIRRTGSPGARYESEATVYFWDGPELADAVEFHIFRNGEAAATIAEIDSWLRSAFEDVMNRRTSG